MRIVLCYPVHSGHIAQIQAAAPEAEIVDAGQERIDELLPTADIFIGHAKVPVDWQRVLQAGRLKWIQSSAAGLDHCLVPGVIDSDIIVSSASGLFAPQVAEQTFALLFGLLRQLPLFFRAEAKREFVRLPTDDLRGKTVGIVGLGGNGRAIAEMLSPWEVEILATDYFADVDCPQSVQRLMPADLLDEMLGQCDIVILALPLNASTLGMFDPDRFSKMRKGAYLINVARGSVVIESALVDALQSGHLSGAGLDVTEVEPLSPASLLWDDPKVIITPHVGAQSARRVDDTTNLACINLKRYLAGQSVFNRVDKTLGFPHPSVVYRGESQ
ncbi:D-2-hydroxyacid dehydrogenase [Stieleria varia]|uniref:Putative 2-hydroxyacid dehydrogenase n=1 Tax=Stieleria varia TaxID=2528005 RepID=A0A5C6B7S1_9BACT|nr:D-2-hydroxyacid dehydrogenase [Stieleria varia]TWU08305.1 putative 2-hydroxyacid dehydrogenase [Stieleria varia]